MANCYAADGITSDIPISEAVGEESVTASDIKDDSSTDHSMEQQIVTEVLDKSNESQIPNNNHVKSPAVGQVKVNLRGTSPTVTGKDEGRGIIDPQKVKEREERLRMARERREEAQKRRMEELQEALARHQEARKKQEDERRRKIEEMKRREEEHRSIVEERRKKLLDDENERRQAILRRNAEREARLELLKPVKHSTVASSFGGSVAPNLSGPRMNAVAPPNAAALGTPLRRSAISVRDVAGSSTDPRSNSRSTEFGQENNSVAIKRLSVSTSQLSSKRLLPSADRRTKNMSGSADEDIVTKGFKVLQPFGCAKGSGNQSNGTVSTDSTPTDRSRHQQRRSRPRSLVVNWRSPGYASDTVSSLQLKASHNGCGSTSFVASGGVVCSRFRSVSPSTKARACSTGPVTRKSRVDAAKNADHRVNDNSNMDPLDASSKTQKLARVKSMPSKLNADSKNSSAVSSVVTPKPSHSNDVTMSRARTQSLKRISQPQPSATESTPTTTKSMPNPPKPMTPRSVPKEPRALKDVTSTSSVSTQGKGSVKAVHNLPDQKSVRDKKPSSGQKDNFIPIKSDTTCEKSDIGSDAGSSQESSSGVCRDARVDGNNKSSYIQTPAEIQATNEDVTNEKMDVAKKTSSGEDDYKSKLAENRRLAREKADREAAEEKQREEDRMRMEEEERLREEEEQRLRDEEEMRHAEEARRQEEERFQRAVEEAERQRREEEERLEAERREKQEMELRMQAEAEKKEKERLERLKREEEERLERKKKLELIMKRVKTDEGSFQKQDVQSSPVGSVAEGLNTMSSSESLNMSDPARTQVVTAVVGATLPTPENGVSKFRSPLLRQMMEGKLTKASGSRTELTDTSSNNTSLSTISQQNFVGAETASTEPAVNCALFDADDSLTMALDSKVVDDDKDIDESELTGLSSVDSDQFRLNRNDQSLSTDFSNVSTNSSSCVSPDALIRQGTAGNDIDDNNFGDQSGFEQVIDLSLTAPSAFGDGILQLTNGHDSRPPPAQPLIAFD